MKLCLMSDPHGQLERFNPDDDTDLILATGDITNLGLQDPKSVAQFEAWAAHYTYQSKLFYIPGNHDLGFKDQQVIKSGINILHTTINFQGARFYGCSLATCYNMPELASVWENMTTNQSYEKAYYADIPTDIDVLLSHSPPAGYDFSLHYPVIELPSLNAQVTGEAIDIGSQELTKYIKEHQPKLVICGHVHQRQPRQQFIGKTLVINVATLQMNLEFNNEYFDPNKTYISNFL